MGGFYVLWTSWTLFHYVPHRFRWLGLCFGCLVDNNLSCLVKSPVPVNLVVSVISITRRRFWIRNAHHHFQVELLHRLFWLSRPVLSFTPLSSAGFRNHLVATCFTHDTMMGVTGRIVIVILNELGPKFILGSTSDILNLPISSRTDDRQKFQ